MLKKILSGLAMIVLATAAMAAVEVNKASESDLDGVKGIGPATTRQIVAERKKSEFKNWEDFKSRVKGIGDARASKLSAQGLTVGGETYKPMTTAVKPKDGEKK